LAELHFASYDAASEHVFVHEMARFQIAESLKPGDKQIPGIIRDLKAVHASRFARVPDEICRRVPSPQRLREPLANPFRGPPKPRTGARTRTGSREGTG